MSERPSAARSRLRKHADYQRVYRSGRKQFSKQISYFFAPRSTSDSGSGVEESRVVVGPRIGLTVGKVLGKAVDRNRIKRRLRETIRHNLPLLAEPVDVILHPRRSAISLPFTLLEHEVANIFRSIQRQSRISVSASKEAPLAKESGAAPGSSSRASSPTTRASE